jgi:hypothetical protein
MIITNKVLFREMMILIKIVLVKRNNYHLKYNKIRIIIKTIHKGYKNNKGWKILANNLIEVNSKKNLL